MPEDALAINNDQWQVLRFKFDVYNRYSAHYDDRAKPAVRILTLIT